MARMTTLVLLLSLVIAPIAAAHPQDAEESLTDWLAVLSDAANRLISWLTLVGQQAEHGAYIDPSGSPTVVFSQQGCTENGLFIDPSGQPCSALAPVTASPQSHEGTRTSSSRE